MRPNNLLAKGLIYIYGWLDRIGLMYIEQIPLDRKVDENYFKELRKISPHTTEGAYLEVILNLETKRIIDQWLLTQNGIFEVN